MGEVGAELVDGVSEAGLLLIGGEVVGTAVADVERIWVREGKVLETLCAHGAIFALAMAPDFGTCGVFDDVNFPFDFFAGRMSFILILAGGGEVADFVVRGESH